MGVGGLYSFHRLPPKWNLCGLEIDRDLNAAINIRNYYTLKHSGINACGDENKTNKKPLAASLKQEVSII
jgi:hypothetical protein